MSVHQLPDGRWFVRFPKGKIAEKPTATREYFGRGDDARNRAHVRNIDLGLGELKKGSGKSFSEIAEYYLRSKNGKIEDKSVETAHMHIVSHLEPFFGNTDVTSIDDNLLDQYVSHRSHQAWRAGGGRGELKKGVSRSTIKRELGTMQAVLNFAAKRREIVFNPAIHYDMPKEDDAVISPATGAEISAILAVSPPHLQRFLIIAYYTAVRPGYTELLTMKWGQVDFAGRIVNVVSARKGGLEARRISMHPDLERYLNTWYEEDTSQAKMPEHIIHYHGQHIKKVDNAWKIAKKKAKVLRRLRLYDIRHASITGMLEAGGDLKAVSMAAGHKNPAMTMRKYQHVSTRLQEVAVAGLVTLVTVKEETKTLEPKPGA
jgi:integrase